MVSEREHLQNILKILSVDGYDEVIADRIYTYVYSRGLMKSPSGHPERDKDVAEIDKLLASTPEVV